ncbi:phage minor head protein [Metasolibacillus meyeri]|uniref:phage minor head protein n=1 Tax=Metasolibacillus meyeri TaxID=1071052 RepID=UPI000D3037C2|nr:phage minor head protein [Metasolibacillus meyeri]
MNIFEIHEYVDELILKAETKIALLHAKMLKEILATLLQMYEKYGRGDELSYTDLNKYNRLHTILNRIANIATREHKRALSNIKQLREMSYSETYLRKAYVTEVFSSTRMGFDAPSQRVIDAALENPIEHLKLNKVMQQHRAKLIRDLQVTISQSLLRGDGYFAMAKHIEQQVGFSRNKAITVARTEAARAQAIAAEKVDEQAKKYVKLTNLWASALDLRVRKAHQILDGQRADKEGYFHYQGLKSKRPHGWNRADMDINCRCIVISLINGMFPSVRRGKDYKDETYQRKLAARIDKYMGDGLTYAQAFKKADKEIKPPNINTDGYITFERWKEEYVYG